MSQEISGHRFREELLNQVDAILHSCEEAKRPLEMDPARSELFDLFVSAEAAGTISEDSPFDLTADGLCKSLAERWGLKNAAENSVRQQTNLSPEHVARMRSLWSLLRMWMEWTYAWERWSEFHSASGERLRSVSIDGEEREIS